MEASFFSSNNDIAIIVACHKECEVPSGGGYLPLQVGRAVSGSRLNMQADDQGDNISSKNKNYCELTGLYWLWKNNNSRVVGLAHYRRYFEGGGGCQIDVSGEPVADARWLASELEGFRVILPKPRNYLIESVRSQYRNAHYEEDYKALRGAVKKISPDYMDDFDSVFSGTKLSLFNMFVMRREDLDSYCSWLFSVLAEVELTIDISGYGQYQSRVYGFMAERLLNVWVAKNIPRGEVKYLSVKNLDGEGYIEKAKGLLVRKFLSSGKKL